MKTKWMKYDSRDKGVAVLFFSTVVLFLVALIIGYRFAFWSVERGASALDGEWGQYTQSEHYRVKELQSQVEQHISLLTHHVGRIEANLMRINALGERLVESARLDPQEFNFGQEVGIGGPADRELLNDSLLTALKELDVNLERRYARLRLGGQRQVAILHEESATAKG